MEKVFYLITSKEYINNEGQKDLGTDFKKIKLSNESEDFWEYKECFHPNSSELEDEYIWECYIDFFLQHFKDELEREKEESKDLWIYESLLLTEQQYRMLFHQMSKIHLYRNVNVMDFKLNKRYVNFNNFVKF